MDSETFDSIEIFKIFSIEFRKSNLFWRDFLKTKDLGIEHVVNNLYPITDRKKFMLSKIKYGL
jgi:hypothetical protein